MFISNKIKIDTVDFSGTLHQPTETNLNHFDVQCPCSNTLLELEALAILFFIGNDTKFRISDVVKTFGLFAGDGVFDSSTGEMSLIEDCLIVAHKGKMGHFNQCSLSVVNWLAYVEDFAVVVHISIETRKEEK